MKRVMEVITFLTLVVVIVFLAPFAISRMTEPLPKAEARAKESIVWLVVTGNNLKTGDLFPLALQNTGKDVFEWRTFNPCTFEQSLLEEGKQVKFFLLELPSDRPLKNHEPDRMECYLGIEWVK